MANARSPEANELLVAIVEAVENPVGLIELLSECEDLDDAVNTLQFKYGWNEIQARAVLNMQFRRVVRESRQLIRRQLEGDE